MASNPETVSNAEMLAWYFYRNGYVRRLDPERRRESPRAYKKGDEVRLVATSQRELREIRRLLRAAGFEPGRAFRKGRQYRQPLYGRAAVEEFLDLIGADPEDPRATPALGRPNAGSAGPG